MKPAVRSAIGVDNEPSAYRCWKRAQELYASKNANEMVTTMSKLVEAKYTNFKSANEYIAYLREHSNRLAEFNVPLLDFHLAAFLTHGLPKEMEPFYIQILHGADRAGENPTFDELAQAISRKDSKESKESNKALKVGNFGKQNKSKGGYKGGKPKCDHCKGLHKKEKCWYLHPDLRPQKWEAPNKDLLPKSEKEKEKTTLMDTTRMGNQTGWQLDSAVDIHITGNRSILHSYTARERTICGINRSNIISHGVGSVTFDIEDNH